MDAAPTPRTGLLDAAELLFARRGFGPPPSRPSPPPPASNTALLTTTSPTSRLYRAVLERAFGGLISEGERRLAGTLDPEAAVRAFIALQAAYFGRHPHRPHLFVRELIDHGAEYAAGQLTRLAATLFRRLCDVIERGTGRQDSSAPISTRGPPSRW
jgi:AcrR family transcriptional regulator